MTTLRVKAGDTLTRKLAVKKADKKTAQPLAGIVLKFMAKDRRADADAAAVLNGTSVASAGITITDAPGGLADLAIAVPAATAPRGLYWELQSTDALGAVRTLEDGRLIVLPDVIRTP